MTLRRCWLSVLLCATAACGASQAASPDPDAPTTPRPTIAGVGILPDTIARESEPPVIIRPPVNEDGTVAELVGQKVNGNRFMMIGDSILAATDRRFGGEMCAALVPLGWVVEVNAEPGRFVEFGTRVLDRRLDPGDGAGWDAAAVFLGSNYRGDEAAYESELREILGRLAPRPTLLFTVTVYRPAWAEVNEVVERLADELDHVELVDWRTVAETPGVLQSDGLHPSEAGAEVLADLTAAQLGRAPVGEGECLRSQFTDSSAITVPTVATSGSSGSGTSGSSGSATSGSGSSGSSGSGSSGSSGSGSSGSATTTTAPSSPPTTAPSTTSGPPTSAPSTSAPPTTTRPTTTSPPPPPSTSPPPPPSTSPPPPPTTASPTTTSP